MQATAFVPAFGSRRQSTFYRYTVVNRGAQPIEDLHVGFFADTDLGSFDDDYVGSDSTRGMAYTYNGAATDAQYGVPPALGFDVLSGMRSAAYFRNGPSGGPATDPDTPPAYYNYLSGLWGDGTPMRALSDGYDEPASAPVTRFMFPADPIANQPWSEENPGPGLTRNEPADRRFSVAAPAVTLAPGASTTVDMGILFAQGTDRFDSLTRLRALSDQTQLAYDLGLVYSGGLPEGTLAAPALVAPAANTQFYEAPAVFEWAPVGGAEAYLLEISETPDFAGAGGELSTETTQTLSADGFRANRTAPLYWRVRAFAGGEVSPPSEARLFRVYRYVPGPETLESGAYAFVETTAPGGGPACEPDDPDEGCAEVQGDLVYRSPNSTGDYSLDFTPAGIDGLIGFSGVDYEIRFTDAGSVAYTTESPRRLFRVPFELWTVTGAVPGGPAPGKTAPAHPAPVLRLAHRHHAGAGVPVRVRRVADQKPERRGLRHAAVRRVRRRRRAARRREPDRLPERHRRRPGHLAHRRPRLRLPRRPVLLREDRDTRAERAHRLDRTDLHRRPRGLV